MARLYTDGFEIGANWPGPTTYLGTPGYVTSGSQRTGTYAQRFNAASSSLTKADLVTRNTLTLGTTTLYLRIAMACDVLPVGNVVRVLGFGPMGANNNVLAGIGLNPDGSLTLYQNLTALSSTAAGVVAADGSWHVYEVKLFINTGAVDTCDIRRDGTTILTATSAAFAEAYGTSATTIGAAVWGVLTTGTAPSTWPTLRFDDVAVNDSSGASENSWPGGGKVVHLVPISDQARATLWTGGAGGTTSLFAAVDNIPPVGVASASATNTSQIEHAGSAAGTTDAYNANLQTYTTGGIGASDTIAAVHPVMVHGEDISTGTKLIAIQQISNPAGTQSASFEAGNNAGACGTYPTLWYMDFGPPVYAPTPTLGTSPQLSVIRPETASRVASVCYMALIVDYAPPSAAALAAAVSSVSTATATTLNLPHALASAIASVSTATATRLSLDHALAAVVSSVSTVTADRLIEPQALAAAVSSVSTVTASRLIEPQALSAAVAGSGVVTANLSAGGGGAVLASAISGSGTLAADLSLAPRAVVYWAEFEVPDAGAVLAATITGSGTLVATQLTEPHALTATITAVSTATADRLVEPQALAAAIAASSTATATTLNLPRALAAAVSGAGVLTADLSPAGAGAALAATVSGVGTLTATQLTEPQALAATVTGASTMTASALVEPQALAATVAGSSTLTALRLVEPQSLAAACSGAGVLSAALSLPHALTAALSGTSAMTASSIQVGHPLIAASAGGAVVTAELTPAGAGAALAASVTATGTLTAGNLRILSHALAATVAGAGTVTASLGGNIVLAATVAGSSVATATRLTVDHPLASTVTATSAMTATRVTVGHAMVAGITGGAVLTASTLRVNHALAAVVAGSSTMAAAFMAPFYGEFHGRAAIASPWEGSAVITMDFGAALEIADTFSGAGVAD